MIYLGSRYETAEVQYVLDGRALTTRPTVMRGALTQTPAQIIYRWVEDDRVDLLGQRYAGRPDEWWRVLDLNPELIDPLSAVPGQSVTVQ